jgi:hypothetical protein
VRRWRGLLDLALVPRLQSGLFRLERLLETGGFARQERIIYVESSAPHMAANIAGGAWGGGCCELRQRARGLHGSARDLHGGAVWASWLTRLGSIAACVGGLGGVARAVVEEFECMVPAAVCGRMGGGCMGIEVCETRSRHASCFSGLPPSRQA